MDFWFFYVFEYTLSAFQFFLICAFANSVYPNSKNIFTSMNETTGHDGVFIIGLTQNCTFVYHNALLGHFN